MQQGRVRIGIDIYGGDNAPQEILEGVKLFLESRDVPKDIEITLYGGREEIEKILLPLDPNKTKNIFISHTRDFIPMDSQDVERSMKNNPNTSLALLLRDIKSGALHTGFSAGNTGILVEKSALTFGRIRNGLLKFNPALTSLFPKVNLETGEVGNTLVLDLGGFLNGDAEKSKEAYIKNTLLGIAYMQAKGVKNPKVGMINIGKEENKGTPMMQEVHKVLKERFGDTFVGNIEPNDMFSNFEVDVLVTDALIGNIALKSAEGAFKTTTGYIKYFIRQSLLAKIGALLLKKPVFDTMKEHLSPKKRGAAMILGLNHPVFKVHGNAKRDTIAEAIRIAYHDAKNDTHTKTKECLSTLLGEIII